MYHHVGGRRHIEGKNQIIENTGQDVIASATLNLVTIYARVCKSIHVSRTSKQNEWLFFWEMSPRVVRASQSFNIEHSSSKQDRNV